MIACLAGSDRIGETRSREKHDIRLGTSYHQVSLTQNLTCEVLLG